MHHCRRDSQFPNKLLACVVGVVVHINDVLHVLGFDLSNVGIPIVVDVGLIHGKLAGPSVDGIGHGGAPQVQHLHLILVEGNGGIQRAQLAVLALTVVEVTQILAEVAGQQLGVAGIHEVAAGVAQLFTQVDLIVGGLCDGQAVAVVTGGQAVGAVGDGVGLALFAPLGQGQALVRVPQPVNKAHHLDELVLAQLFQSVGRDHDTALKALVLGLIVGCADGNEGTVQLVVALAQLLLDFGVLGGVLGTVSGHDDGLAAVELVQRGVVILGPGLGVKDLVLDELLQDSVGLLVFVGDRAVNEGIAVGVIDQTVVGGDGPAGVDIVGGTQQLQQIAALTVTGGLAAPHIGPDVVILAAHALLDHVLLDADQHVGELVPGPILFQLGDIVAGSVKNVLADEEGVILQRGLLQAGQAVVLAVGLRDGGQVVLHVVLLDELGVVGHILDIVGNGDNAAAGDIRSFRVDLGDDVGGSAGRNGQGNLIGVVGVVNDGQFQMDVGGILDGLKDALADPLVVHGIGGVVVEEHRVGDRLVRVEVLAVLIAEVRLVRSSGVGGSSAAIGVGGACSRGAAGAAAGSQRQHHAGSQHEGCELFHVS